MPLNKVPKSKLRAKIVRKGMFTQLPYLVKNLECEHRLFRTVIDYALYDLTSEKQEERTEVVEWLHPTNKDFIFVCICAGLNPLRVYNMFLFFLQSFFPERLDELHCHQEAIDAIVEFSPEMTMLSSEQLATYLS